MLELAVEALRVADTLAKKSCEETLNEFEAQLYEYSARLATTVLKFQETVSQSALIKAERELDGLRENGGTE